VLEDGYPFVEEQLSFWINPVKLKEGDGTIPSMVNQSILLRLGRPVKHVADQNCYKPSAGICSGAPANIYRINETMKEFGKQKVV
jgi:hypothetical protein